MTLDTSEPPQDSASREAGPSMPGRPCDAPFMLDDEDTIERRLRSLFRRASGGGDSPLLNVGDVVAERYRIDEFMKAGGMGQVFRATQLSLDRQVALKWLLSASSQGACARFIDEARAAARIDHPNVIEVHDAGVHRGGYYLVMELLHGETLAERIRPDPEGAACPLAARELVEIMIPVLRGLAAAHARGVIHRDLKPDNVFLCTAPDGTPSDPKLLDFGICKLLQCDQARTPTSAGVVLGTIPYMSPEQLNDAGRVDHRADIYAAGVMMYEALSGRRPFRAPTAPALIFAILEQAPAPLRSLAPQVPEALEAIVQRAMAKRADQRYPSVKALIEDLSAFARAALPPVSSAPSEPQLSELAQQASLALASDSLLGRAAHAAPTLPRVEHRARAAEHHRPRALSRYAKFVALAGLALGVFAHSWVPAMRTAERGARNKAPIVDASPQTAVPPAPARVDPPADLCMAMPIPSADPSPPSACTSPDSAAQLSHPLTQPIAHRKASPARPMSAAPISAARNPHARSRALVPSPFELQKELVMSPLAGILRVQP